MPTDEAQFERTFGDLAYASMKSRAPMLMEHLVGWQLVDANDDETRAVGIFGFRVGEQWLYAPVFFMNGELKGTELLYLKGQDIFVPLQENWIKYIVNRRPYVLGETEPNTLEQLGYQPPDFTQYSESPETKRAQYEPMLENIKKEWAKTAASHLFSIMPDDLNADKYKASAARFHLPTFFKEAGLPAYETFIRSMQSNDKFANAVMRFYKTEDFRPVTKSSANGKDIFTEKSAAPEEHYISGTAPEVVVILPGNDYADNALKGLTDADKERLLGGEVVIQDHRQGTSNVYPADIHNRLFSPNEDGVYDILMRVGTFRKLLVLNNPYKFSNDSEAYTTVVDPDSGEYMSIHPTSIFAKKRYHDDSWRKLYEGAPEASTMKANQAYVLLGPDGYGSRPFRVIESSDDTKGRTYLKIMERTNLQGGREYLGKHFKDTAGRYDYTRRLNGYGDYTLVLGNVNSKRLRAAGSTTFVPEAYKAIKVDDEYETHTQIDPGTMADMEIQISKLANAYPIKLYNDGHEIHISTGSAHLAPMTKNAAIGELVIKWGMSEEDARDLIKEAGDKKTARATVQIKAAQGSYVQPAPENYVSRDLTAPYYKGDDKNMSFDSLIGVEAQHPYYSNQRVPVPQDPIPLQPYNATADYSNPMQDAADAAASGQKEVFDMSTVSRLTKMTDISESVDRYQSDLINGMDRIGRILFLLYWHYEKFSDRYGKDDLPELEDSLKSTFKQIGDLSLFLKQKSIEPEVNAGTPLLAGGGDI